jgi:phenylacetate-CoA ligase
MGKPNLLLTSGLRRNLVEPLYALKTGGLFLRYWRELEISQYLPENRLHERQWVRLKAILEYAYRHNPYYRGAWKLLGITPDDIRFPDDIRNLPVVTKEEIRNNIDRLISDGYEKRLLIRSKTGGSTGTSLEIWKTEECIELKNAAARRSDRWSGWKVGEPVGAVWGNPELPKTIKARLRNMLLSPCIFLDTINLNEGSVTRFAADWERVRPTLLFGHSHSLFLLSKYVEALGTKNIKPRAIISTSMMLLLNERKTIENVFEVKVQDRYGCEEVSLIASECERHEGYHINIEHLFVEFVKPDGKWARPGEQGAIVVTDLLNRAMPFIRYRVEDVGIPSDRRCSCGRGMPLMEKVVGRVADFLVRKDGSMVAGVSLIERTLTAIKGIKQMQIIQESIDDIVLNIVRDACFTADSREKLVYEIIRALGSPLKVKINFVDRIDQERSGKYRFSISYIEPRSGSLNEQETRNFV